MMSELNVSDIDENIILQLAIDNGIKLDPAVFEISRTRLNAYRSMGWTEKAFDDENWAIRSEAYLVLGYTEKAMMDDDEDIRLEAQQFFQLKKKYAGEAENIVNLWKLERL